MEKKVECRPKLDHRFMIERYTIDARFLRLHTEFIPNLKTQTVTGKFYSVHDVTEEGVDHDLVELIDRKARQGPKDKWSYPVLTSQVYGWYNEPFIKLSKDRRFRQPYRTSEISRFGAAMIKAKSMMK